MNFYYLSQRAVHGKPNYGHLNAGTVNLFTAAHRTRNTYHLTGFLCVTSMQVKPTGATRLRSALPRNKPAPAEASAACTDLGWSSKCDGKYFISLAVSMELLGAGVRLVIQVMLSLLGVSEPAPAGCPQMFCK